MVGIAEDLPKTVKAFEKLISSVFTGAGKIYYSQPSLQQFLVRKGIFGIYSTQYEDTL